MHRPSSVVHFPELIDWCVAHYLTQTRCVVTQISSQIFITITTEEIINMLGLNSTNFLENNVVPLSKETFFQ